MFLRVFPGGARCRLGFFQPFAFRGGGSRILFSHSVATYTPRSPLARRRVSRLGAKTLPVFVVFANSHPLGLGFLFVVVYFSISINNTHANYAPNYHDKNDIITIIALFRVISCNDGYNYIVIIIQ